MTPDEALIAQLQEAHGRATKGPLTWDRADVEVCGICSACKEDNDPEDNCKDITIVGPASVSKIFSVDVGDYCGLNDQDAEFIAKVYNALPRLIELAREAILSRAVVEAMERGLDTLKHIGQMACECEPDADWTCAPCIAEAALTLASATRKEEEKKP